MAAPPPSGTESEARAWIGRRYNVLNQLGRGGMGTVYRVLDRMTGRVLTLKRVRMDIPAIGGSGDREQKAWLALAREFEVLSDLKHPNIITVLDYGFDQGQPYFTMDLQEGAQPFVLGAREDPLAMKVDLLAQLLRALGYLHRRGVLHRDLKPTNVLLVGGQIKVLDFGLSISAELASTSEVAEGTLAYMAPEVLQGKAASRSSDLYAVGVMAYELFVGCHPFPLGDKDRLVRAAVLETPDLTLPALVPRIREFLARLLSKVPEERYQGDAEQALEALGKILGRDFPVQTAQTRESFLRSATLVGREPEIAVFRERILRILSGGEGCFMLVLGEAGVGKSRLLAEARTKSLVRGLRVLRGQALQEGGGAFPLLKEVARGLALELELSPEEAGVLRALVPDLSALVGWPVAPAPHLDPGATLTRLIETFVALLGRLEAPTLLLLEDLHWASQEELQIIRQVGELARTHRIFVLGAAREEEAQDLLPALPTVEVLRLGPLSRPAVAELARFMLGEAGGAPELVDLLMRETEGIALFVVEAARALLDEGFGDGGAAAKVISSGVRAAVSRRLERVAHRDKVLLRLAAVVGRQLDLAVMRALSEPEELDDWLTRVVNAAVLTPHKEGWRFSHDVVRELVLQDLGKHELGVLHRLVAQTLEGLDAEEHASELALHWAGAEEPNRELYWRTRAGEVALRAGAREEARRQLARAVGLAVTLGRAPHEQARLRAALAECCALLGDELAAIQQRRFVLSLLGMRLPQERGASWMLLAGQAARQVAHRLGLLRMEEDPSRRALLQEAARAAGRLAQSAVRANKFLEAASWGILSVNLGDRWGGAVASGLSVTGLALGSLGLRRFGWRYLERAAEAARKDGMGLGEVLLAQGALLIQLGRIDEAERSFDEAFDAATHEHQRTYAALIWGIRAACCWWPRARRGAEVLLDEEGRGHERAWRGQGAFVVPFVALALLQRGSGEEALTLLRQGLAHIGEPLKLARLAAMSIYALLLARMGQFGEAWAQARDCREALRAFRPLPGMAQIVHSSLSEALLLVWAGVGRPEDVAVVAREAREVLRRYRSWARRAPLAGPDLLRLQGEMARLRGDLRGARRSYERAAELAQATGQPLYEALAALALGRLESLDTATRRAHLQRARQLLEGSGMGWTLRQVDEAEAGLGA